MKMSPKRYFRAGGVFVRTSLFNLKRDFPEPLSGVKRKAFPFSVFTTEVWKAAAERKRLHPQSFLTAESATHYIFEVDRILDQIEPPSILTDVLKYKKDDLAKDRLSQFIRQVKGLSLTREEQNRVLSLAGDFRRTARAALIEFEKTPEPTIRDILKMKELTSGEMGRVGASILNVCERIPEGKRKELEDAVSNFSMAAQIVDDIFDVRIDHKDKVPNIALWVLKEHPEELAKALKRRGIGMGWFRKNCPESHKELKSLFENYLSKIPKTTVGLQTLATIPRLLWIIPSLTRR